MKKIITISTIIILIIAVLVIFQDKTKENLLGIDYNVPRNTAKLKYKTKNPVVAMKIKGYGSIVMELYKDIAPITVNNFIKIVKSGYYDGNNFHRLVKGFVIQGGDLTGTGNGGGKEYIKGEFKENGVENNLKHTKGVVSMARASDPNSASTQFFIVLKDSSFLDGKYAAFGKIIDGWDNIEKIEEEEKVTNEKLDNKLIIEKALVDEKN